MTSHIYRPPSLKALAEEKMNLMTSKENYGLGPIIQIKSPRRYSILQKSQAASRRTISPTNLIGAFLLTAFLISCPYIIYQSQTEAPYDDVHRNPGSMSGFGVSRPRWGIVGLGHIAYDFTVILSYTGANITAVAAGSLPFPNERAAAFAYEFNIPYSYGTYEDLAQNDEIDIVYIATTNHLHYNLTKMMLNAGKHVLVEKPTTMSAHETREVFQLAKEKGLLLTTNYWTRYFPAFRYARKHVDTRAIGKIIAVRGDMAIQAPIDQSNRFFNANLGGGALLDLGCYLVQFGTLAAPMDKPNRVFAAGVLASTGVDVEASFALQWTNESVVRAVPDTGPPAYRCIGPSCPNSKAINPADFSNIILGDRNSADPLDDDHLLTLQSESVKGTGKSRLRARAVLSASSSSLEETLDKVEAHETDPLGSRTRRSFIPSEDTPNIVPKDADDGAKGGEEEQNLHHKSSSSSSSGFNSGGPFVTATTKGMTATFTVSFQRESLSSVEFLGEYGTITLLSPANAPTRVHMTISKKVHASGNATNVVYSDQPEVFQEDFTTPIPHWPDKNKRQNYPCTTGLIYVIDAVESCLKLKDCTEMKELTSDEQIRIQEVLDTVIGQVRQNS